MILQLINFIALITTINKVACKINDAVNILEIVLHPVKLDDVEKKNSYFDSAEDKVKYNDYKSLHDVIVVSNVKDVDTVVEYIASIPKRDSNGITVLDDKNFRIDDASSPYHIGEVRNDVNLKSDSESYDAELDLSKDLDTRIRSKKNRKVSSVVGESDSAVYKDGERVKLFLPVVAAVGWWALKGIFYAALTKGIEEGINAAIKA